MGKTSSDAEKKHWAKVKRTLFRDLCFAGILLALAFQLKMMFLVFMSVFVVFMSLMLQGQGLDR